MYCIYSVWQPGEIRRALPLPIFQVSYLLLWPPPCPTVTWLCLIALRSSESCSLILPTLCPTSLHNHPSPNFPYRSHWLSFVCVLKAYSRLLARGCRRSTERIAAASPNHSWSQGWFIIQGLGFFCPQMLIHLQGICCVESIDGEANAFKCKITTCFIMMLLIAAGTACCHLSYTLPSVLTVLLILSNFSLSSPLCLSVEWHRKLHQVRSIYFINTPDVFANIRGCQQVSQGNQWCPIKVPGLRIHQKHASVKQRKEFWKTPVFYLSNHQFDRNPWVYWLYQKSPLTVWNSVASCWKKMIFFSSCYVILFGSSLTHQILITSKVKQSGKLSTSVRDKEWFCYVDRLWILEVSCCIWAQGRLLLCLCSSIKTWLIWAFSSPFTWQTFIKDYSLIFVCFYTHLCNNFTTINSDPIQNFILYSTMEMSAFFICRVRILTWLHNILYSSSVWKLVVR